MRAGSEAIHLSHQSDFHEVKGLNMAARPFETRPPSAQLKVTFMHPAKLPGDDRMFRDYSDVCRAVVIPPRSMGGKMGQQTEPGMKGALAAVAACAPGAEHALPSAAAREWDASACVRHDDGSRSSSASRPSVKPHHADDKIDKSDKSDKSGENDATATEEVVQPDAVYDVEEGESPVEYPPLLSEREPHEGGKCNPACYARGTCYEPLARCDCPSGWSGDDCTTPYEYTHFMPGMERIKRNAQQEEGRTNRDAGSCKKQCGQVNLATLNLTLPYLNSRVL